MEEFTAPRQFIIQGNKLLISFSYGCPPPLLRKQEIKRNPWFTLGVAAFFRAQRKRRWLERDERVVQGKRAGFGKGGRLFRGKLAQNLLERPPTIITWIRFIFYISCCRLWITQIYNAALYEKKTLCSLILFSRANVGHMGNGSIFSLRSTVEMFCWAKADIYASILWQIVQKS